MSVSTGNPGRFGVAAVPDSDQGPFNSIWVGGAGNVVVRQLNGDILYNNVPAGTVLPVAGTRIVAAGTTATLMTLMWN